ncbi:MAG TPA: glycine cleavage system protein GcvH [Acidimicrobiia bacterium]|nr:glycine cleavage system protein GcvH [Acidimicrobiia bacterium]
MDFPSDLRYLPTHEWARVEGDRVTVGISDFAQDALGDIVYVELPALGRSVAANEVFCEVESTKSVSDIYAPVAGEIIEVNTELSDSPQKINDAPYGDGWICVIRAADLGEAQALLDADGYRKVVEEA